MGPRGNAWVNCRPGRDASARRAATITQWDQRPGGVTEMKIDFGPGYRVYFAQRGPRLVLLLAGGDKATQQQDIELAMRLAKEWQE